VSLFGAKITTESSKEFLRAEFRWQRRIRPVPRSKMEDFLKLQEKQKEECFKWEPRIDIPTAQIDTKREDEPKTQEGIKIKIW